MLSRPEGHCVGCEEHHNRPLIDKFALKMSECLACGLVYTYPTPQIEEIADRYSSQWFLKEYLPSYGIDPANPSLDHLTSRYDNELKPLEVYRENGHLLDLGAGAGLLLSQAKARGWEVMGVELSKFGPEYAKKYFGVDILQGTLDTVTLPQNYFDVVVLQDTIEHVPSPISTLRNINKLLRVGGGLLITTPNYASLGRRIAQDQWALISPMEHLALFSYKSLSAALHSAGFTIDKFYTNKSLNPGLLHEHHPAPRGMTRLRRKLLKLAAQSVPGWCLEKFGLGDEIYCVARKVEN